jgi:hypothetical protein
MILARSYAGFHPLHLHEQRLFGARPRGVIEKHDLHPAAFQLLQQQHLIGIWARQAVWRMHRELIDPARGGDITQALQGRADQGCPAVPLVNEDQVLQQWHPGGSDPLPQGSELTLNGVGLRLLLTGDPGIDGDLEVAHLDPPFTGCRCATGIVRLVWRGAQERLVRGETCS